MSSVSIVPTGTANLASVRAAFSRLGVESEVARSPLDITRANRVVMPGVGMFGAAADSIDNLEMRHALEGRIRDGRPTLAICVGMQLLAVASTESPGATGLGVVAETVDRFGNNVAVPQLGWNEVMVDNGLRFISPGWAYFANSYRMTRAPEGWLGAKSWHGEEFISGLERDAVLACQFHPELSGSWGANVLAKWLSYTERSA